MGLLDAFGTTQALFNRLGATRLERSICGPQWFALSGITGWPWSDPENLPDAKMVVVWGMDPVSTSIHTWELIRRARKESGAELVVVDPYRSRTTRYADLHLRPNPGTDGALALAVANVIFSEGLEDAEYVADHTTDVDAYRTAVEPWTPERAAAETGVPAGDIVDFARRYASARPAAIRLGVGMQRSTGSGSALRAIQCLPALTGQWRWPSGGVAGAVSIGQTNLAALSRPDLCPPGTREVNMIQLGRVLTDPTMDPAIRALFVWNSNPAVIAADQQKVLEGLRRDDLFTVVHDQFVTDTARYADIVLPATTMLEHADVVGSWGFSYLSWNEAAIDPVGESQVERRGGPASGSPAGLHRRRVRARRSPTHGTRAGRLARGCRRRERRGAPHERICSRVGPPIGTAVASDATFAFSNEALAAAGLHPVAEYRPPARTPMATGRYPLRLLTLKRHYSINSSYGNLPVMLNAEPGATAEMHPDDAAARAIADGAEISRLQRPRPDPTDRHDHRQRSGGNDCRPIRPLGDAIRRRRRQLTDQRFPRRPRQRPDLLRQPRRGRTCATAVIARHDARVHL